MVAVASSSLAAAAGVQQGMNGLSAGDIASVARTRAIDLRLSQELAPDRPALLVPGMIVRHDFAPNASVGLGLANIYGKKKVGSETRVDGRSRKPAITFVLKF